MNNLKPVMRIEHFRVKNKPLLTFTNKELYSLLIESKFCKPIAHLYWNNVFEKAIDWTSFYKGLYKVPDNRIKQFKFKLLNNIFPSNSTKYQWGMIKSPNCHICNVVETYEHVFIDCPAVNLVWDLVSECFSTYGITQPIRNLAYIVLGYNISNPEYLFVNLIFSILGFSKFVFD